MSGNKHYMDTIAAISNLFYGPDAAITPNMALARMKDELGIEIPYSTFMKYVSGDVCPPPLVIKGLFIITEDPGIKFVLEPKGWQLIRRGGIRPTHASPVDELMDDIAAATATHREIQTRLGDCNWSTSDQKAALAMVERQKRDIEETEAAIREMPIGPIKACKNGGNK